MWENGHHSGSNLKLPLMTLICQMSVNLHTWDPCWKVMLNNVSRVSLCLVRIIPLRVICWKPILVGRNKLFSLMCRTCWIYLFLPNVLLNRSLESFWVSWTQYGVILTPVIVSRLPEDIHLEWARKGAGHESDLKWLLTFLESDIKCRERSQMYEDKVSSAAPQVPKERNKVIASTVFALQSSSSSGRGCLVCEKNHATERCFKLTHVSFNECRELLRSHGLITDVWGKAISRVVVLQHVRVATDVTTGFSVYVVIMLNMVDSHRTRVNLVYQIAQQVRVMWQSRRAMIHQSNQGLPQLTVLQVSQCLVRQHKIGIAFCCRHCESWYVVGVWSTMSLFCWTLVATDLTYPAHWYAGLSPGG